MKNSKKRIKYFINAAGTIGSPYKSEIISLLHITCKDKIPGGLKT